MKVNAQVLEFSLITPPLVYQCDITDFNYLSVNGTVTSHSQSLASLNFYVQITIQVLAFPICEVTVS